MPNTIHFKEPERCDYLYIDGTNKVHLLLPVVGGDEIGLDNTCQAGVELKAFFFGSSLHGNMKTSAEEQLAAYKQHLEEDIEAIKSQKGISRSAYAELLKEKKERLKQIEEYIELIQVLKEQYDGNKEIAAIEMAQLPVLPSALVQMAASSSNAHAVRLSPNSADPYTQFENPLFMVDRGGLTEGLGYRLRTAFRSTKINNKTTKDKIVETVLAQVPADFLRGKDREEHLKTVKDLIQHEFGKIDSNLSVHRSRGPGSPEIDIAHMEMIYAMGEEDDIRDWISGIIDAAVEPDYWQAEAAGAFYDGAKEIRSERDADAMSIRVQFFLSEVNFYCKTNQLSDANFGAFFDKEPHATEIAQRVKYGLEKGEAIEPILYQYINSNYAALGLSAPLTGNHQHDITKKFTEHYAVIKDSPHFDEFFIIDPDKPGNFFVHQNRISCHFLDFFIRQTNGRHPLGHLNGHVAALQEESSNRLNHSNDVVVKGYEKIEQFRQKVVQLLAENKPKELVSYLTATSSAGVPNYSLLSLETQNYIAYNRNWPAIERELKEAGIQPKMKDDLLKLLSPDKVQHYNLSAITWSHYSSKPLWEVELSKIAEGLSLTADIYDKKRSWQWYKGVRNEKREAQYKELKAIAEEISTTLQNPALSNSEMLETLLKSMDALDKIDKEIAAESNWFQSTLQKEVRLFRNQLQGLCELENFAFREKTIDVIISLKMEEQFNKITDPQVQQIVRNLPSHCHSDAAIDFFTTLNAGEAAKVACYLSLEYREINETTNKETLLEQDIPQLFREVNLPLLAALKEQSVINDACYDKLSQLADKIPPDRFTRSNIEKWSTDLKTLEVSNLNELLGTRVAISQQVSEFKKAMGRGNEEMPDSGMSSSRLR